MIPDHSNAGISFESCTRTLHGFHTILVVMMAKTEVSVDHTFPKLLLYIDIIHAPRKDAGKDDNILYGLSPDGTTDKFVRLDHSYFFDPSRDDINLQNRLNILAEPPDIRGP